MAVEDNDQTVQFALTGNGGVQGDSGRGCSSSHILRKKVGSYDILTEAGKVKPKAITNPETYQSKSQAR